MPRQRAAAAGGMVDRIALAIAKADGQALEKDPTKYSHLAIAALKPLVVPTEAMIDAAHQAVWFDAFWAINSRRDFRRAVRAMITYAITEGQGGGAGQ
jgi:hypothetical protein